MVGTEKISILINVIDPGWKALTEFAKRHFGNQNCNVIDVIEPVQNYIDMHTGYFQLDSFLFQNREMNENYNAVSALKISNRKAQKVRSGLFDSLEGQLVLPYNLTRLQALLDKNAGLVRFNPRRSDNEDKIKAVFGANQGLGYFIFSKDRSISGLSIRGKYPSLEFAKDNNSDFATRFWDEMMQPAH